MKPIGRTWRQARYRSDLAGDEAARRLGIKHRSLLNIESEQRSATVSERLAWRASRLYELPVSELVVAEAGNEGVSDESPQQTTQPPKKQRRKQSAGNGPKRAQSESGAA